MNRFFLKPEDIDRAEIHFPPDITHQILNVLRLREGDLVCVLDNQGRAHRVRLFFDRDGSGVRGKIIATEPVSNEPKAKISLCFGMSNRENVELILQKATEVGVSSFFPFISSRTLVPSTKISEKKIARWERIIREAAEQSQRGRLPVLHPPMNLAACVQAVGDTHERMLAAWEEAQPLPNSLRSTLSSEQAEPLALFVGPEGGFSAEDLQCLSEAGCEVVSLGARILRMETAAIVFPALVLYHLGDL